MVAEKMTICDMHGHFLPGIDDGCSNLEESIGVLQESARQGIHKMFATPHYYPVETVERFLERREQAAQSLRAHLQAMEEDLPEFILGAEVAFHAGISQEADLEKLCLGKSRYLLLEMPFEKWNSSVIREVNTIIGRGIVPIIAHLERYIRMQDPDTLERLLQLKALVQVNAGALLRFSSRGHARSMLKDGVAQLIGSDCHNMTTRKPNMGPAVAYLEKKHMADVLDAIARRSNCIFAEALGNDQ